jgi:hypothetical protein
MRVTVIVDRHFMASRIEAFRPLRCAPPCLPRWDRADTIVSLRYYPFGLGGSGLLDASGYSFLRG